jgi:LruC domain-containing protein/uncharacterized repeat protein (TIGR01451 family)
MGTSTAFAVAPDDPQEPSLQEVEPEETEGDVSLSSVPQTGKITGWNNYQSTSGYVPSIQNGQYHSVSTVVFKVKIDGKTHDAFCTDLNTHAKKKPVIVDPDRSCRITRVIETYNEGKIDWRTAQIAIWHIADSYDVASPAYAVTAVRDLMGYEGNSLPDIPAEGDCTFSNPDPTVVSISPSPSITVLPDRDQEFTVRVSRGDTPVSGKDVKLTTTFGSFSNGSKNITVTTDSNGEATIVVSSSSAGKATIEATVEDVVLPIGTRLLPLPENPDQQILVLADEAVGPVATNTTAEWLPKPNGSGGTVVVHMFRDDNTNGVQDNGEPDLKNWNGTNAWQVNLTGPSTDNTKAVNSNANAVFDGLSTGTYTAQEMPADQDVWAKTTDTSSATIENEGDSAVINMGFVNVENTPTIEGVSYVDMNSDLRYTEGVDELLEGSTIEINPTLNGVGHRETNAEGSALFSNVVVNNKVVYTVSHTPAAGEWCGDPIVDPDRPDGKVGKSDFNNSDLVTLYFGVTPCDAPVYPALVVNAEANPTTVMTNDEIEYTVTVENVGKEGSVAQNVVLTNDLPENMTFVSGSATFNGNGMSDPSDNSWTLPGTLDGQETATITFKVKVDKAVDGEQYTYTASATANDADGNAIPADNSGPVPADNDPDDSDTAMVIGISAGDEAALVVNAEADPAELKTGDNVMYTVTVENVGNENATATDMVVTSTLPENMTYVENSGTLNGEPLADPVDGKWNIPGNLDSQQKHTIQFEAEVTSASQGEEYVYTASATANDGNGDAIPADMSAIIEADTDPDDSDTATVVGLSDDAALVVTAEAGTEEVKSGDRLEYTVTVENVGSEESVAEDIIVTNSLPENMTYVEGSATLNGEPMDDPAGNNWLLSESLVGQTAHTIVFSVDVNKAAQDEEYTYTASATANDGNGEPVPADNSEAVPADTDPDDADTAMVTGLSSLEWEQEPETAFIAFEDLKNTDWCDWDYNDFVVHMSARKQIDTGLEAVNAIEITFQARAKGAGFNHTLLQKLPVNGSGRYELTVTKYSGETYEDSGTFDSDPEVVIFGNTGEAFPEPGTEYGQVNALPEQTSFVAGDTAVLTVYMDDPAANPVRDFVRAPFPWDPYIIVIDTGEEIHMAGPGRTGDTQPVDTQYDPDVPVELLGQDMPLVQQFDSVWKWPLENEGIWKGYPDYIKFFNTGGAQNQDWFQTSVNQSYIWQYAQMLQMQNTQ